MQLFGVLKNFPQILNFLLVFLSRFGENGGVQVEFVEELLVKPLFDFDYAEEYPVHLRSVGLC
jgi:hypothetical protein